MILQLKNVEKTYQKANFSLTNITFSVQQGDCIGLIGQNGTGKSTLLKMMTGLVSADHGEILYHGTNIQQLKPMELRRMRQNIAYIFQQANLLAGETVLYHLKLVYTLQGKKPDWATIEQTLDFMRLTPLKQVVCRDLSGGQQQKVAIAMAILQEPQVLLCDEISSALDANSEREIFELLDQLRQERQIAIVMISHNLSLLKNFCDRVMILDKGELAETITPVKSTDGDISQHYVTHVKEFLSHAN